MTTDNATQRQIRILRTYTVLSTTMLGILAITAFHRASEKTRFEEIDVERINLVEKDGRVRLVIANDARSPAVILSGRPLTKPGGRAGMIFHNDEGDENGGLIFRGRKVNGEAPFGAPRLFVGRDTRKAAALELKDQYGRSRLRLAVDSLGAAHRVLE